MVNDLTNLVADLPQSNLPEINQLLQEMRIRVGLEPTPVAPEEPFDTGVIDTPSPVEETPIDWLTKPSTGEAIIKSPRKASKEEVEEFLQRPEVQELMAKLESAADQVVDPNSPMDEQMALEEIMSFIEGGGE